MKKLLAITIIFFPALLIARQKSGSFIKEHLYIKVSPSLLGVAESTERLLPENSLNPAIFGSVGAKIRYAALGFSAGYFNMESAGPISPLGADLTLTDFKRKKAFPVITAQWHRAHFKENHTIGRIQRNTIDISGKDMFSINGGLAFRALKTTRILVTLGYSKLRANTTITSRDQYNPEPSISYAKDNMEMAVLTASIVL
jgi:hypothetical protein